VVIQDPHLDGDALTYSIKGSSTAPVAGPPHRAIGPRCSSTTFGASPWSPVFPQPGWQPA